MRLTCALNCSAFALGFFRTVFRSKTILVNVKSQNKNWLNTAEYSDHGGNNSLLTQIRQPERVKSHSKRKPWDFSQIVFIRMRKLLPNNIVCHVNSWLWGEAIFNNNPNKNLLISIFKNYENFAWENTRNLTTKAKSFVQWHAVSMAKRERLINEERIYL